MPIVHIGLVSKIRHFNLIYRFLNHNIYKREHTVMSLIYCLSFLVEKKISGGRPTEEDL